MGDVKRQQAVTIERHVVTREGELDVKITLNINITLNQNGEASVTVSDEPAQTVKKKQRETELEIPDFETPMQLVDFGQPG